MRVIIIVIQQHNQIMDNHLINSLKKRKRKWMLVNRKGVTIKWKKINEITKNNSINNIL